MKYFLFIITICLLTFSARAQVGEAVQLQWKIAPHDTLRYETVVVSINDRGELPYIKDWPSSLLHRLDEIRIAARTTVIEKLDPDLEDYPQRLLAGYLGIGDEPKVFSALTAPKTEVIGVMMYKEKTQQEVEAYREEIESLINTLAKTTTEKTEKDDSLLQFIRAEMSKGLVKEMPFLMGSVYANGGLQSFYLSQAQKNALALFFELPKKKVRINDTWHLDVHLITLKDFQCDSSSRRNLVTLQAIRQQGQDHIAVLAYDVTEFVSGTTAAGIPTTMKIAYTAQAEFSIDTGQWIKYDGLISMNLIGDFIVSSGTFLTNVLFSFQKK